MRESRNHVVNRDSTERKIKWFYGNFAGELEILFSDSSAGIVEEKSRFLAYSRLKMPHSAPGDGYGPSLHFASTSVKPQFRDEDIGYFIRTRAQTRRGGQGGFFPLCEGDYRLLARSSRPGVVHVLF
jgi:hypothetical protein